MRLWINHFLANYLGRTNFFKNIYSRSSVQKEIMPTMNRMFNLCCHQGNFDLTKGFSFSICQVLSQLCSELISYFSFLCYSISFCIFSSCCSKALFFAVKIRQI
ncbi:hypothetical protein FGO68_gene7636 [Halteria grandinella]|uniref:Uncharacterized protein n=1 Tax=Halteria grandinella TaxID=5974 RepID=A0A8J8NH62_HALGN|nr:hypothetical protein FGO68_gene7636 [Halteria grandinella]